MKLSFTALSDWRKCHRLADLKSKWEPTEIPPQFWFGDLVHQAIEAYYVKGEHPTNTFQMVARKRQEELRPDKYEELYDLGRGILDHLADWLAYDDAQKGIKVTSVEEWWETKLPKTEHLMVGKVDAKLTADGEPWIHEVKTMERIEKDWLMLNEQATLYLWAAKRVWPKIPWKGVLFTLIRKKAPAVPEIRDGAMWLRSNADTSIFTLKQFKAANKKVKDPDGLMDKYRDLMGRTYVERQWITRNANQLKEIEERTRQIATEIQTSPPFPNPTIVNCRGCGFHEVCVAMERGDNFRVLLNEFYRPKPPKPAAHQMWVLDREKGVM